MDCVFCKIVRGELPAHVVYEDKYTIAFLDIKPVAPGHTLVMPKEHHVNLEAIPSELLCKVMQAVKKVGSAIKEKLPTEGYNASTNNDPIAGQVIPHIHFHIVPRADGDGLELWPQHNYKHGEAEKVAGRIKIS